MGEDDKGKNATIRRRPTRRAHEGFVFCLSRFRMGGKRCGSGAITQADLTRDGAQGMAAFAGCSRNAFIATAAGVLTPLELIQRLAALIPPPRRHRHRDCGVLAPNAPLRSAVTALAGC